MMDNKIVESMDNIYSPDFEQTIISRKKSRIVPARWKIIHFGLNIHQQFWKTLMTNWWWFGSWIIDEQENARIDLEKEKARIDLEKEIAMDIPNPAIRSHPKIEDLVFLRNGFLQMYLACWDKKEKTEVLRLTQDDQKCEWIRWSLN